jgi:hypothetical protein
MSCGGGHLGFPIGIKNLNFVEDHSMIIPGQFTTNMIKAKLYMNVHWMVLYKLKFFFFQYEIQNGGYGRTSFNIGPYGKNVSKRLFSETT